jgi:hypothetical protein
MAALAGIRDAVYPKPPVYSAQMPLSASSQPQFPLPPQPVPGTPLSAPNLPPSPQAPGFGFTPPPAPGAAPTATPTGGFTGTAPTATPYGAFSGPNLANIGNDPYYKFRLSQGLKGIERGAAARGTLLTGGLQQRLMGFGQEMASAEGDKIYGRALNDYTTNRDTSQQNFGNSLASFQGSLAGYGSNRDTNAQNFGQSLSSYTAGTGAALGAGGLALNAANSAYDRAYAAGRDTYGDAAATAANQNDISNANNQAQDAYRRQMSEYAAQVEAQRAAANAAQNAAPLPMPARRPLPGDRISLGRR